MLTPLTDFALALDARTLYALMTVQRGPDSDLPIALREIKGMLTARFRDIAWRWPWGGYDALDLTRLQDLVTTARDWPGWEHFGAHLVEAMRATSAHPVWEKHGDEILRIVQATVSARPRRRKLRRRT